MGDYGQHTFPLLKSDEIIQCMEELRIHFTLEDLTKPNPQHLQRVYENFLDLLMGTPREEYDNPNFAVLEILESPDLHASALSELAFFRMVLKFMNVVGVYDFSMKDFHRPTPERVRKILSAVINFAKFREEQLSEFEKYTIETDQLTEKKIALEQENNILAEKLHTARLQRAEEEPTIQKVESEITALRIEANQLNKDQAGMQKEFAVLKQQTVDLANKLNHQKGYLGDLRQQCTRLSSQIVESPEKLKQSLLDLDISLVTERDAVVALEKNSRELLLKIDSFSQVEVDVEKTSLLMGECEIELKKLQEVEKNLSAVQDLFTRKNIELKEVALKDQHLKRQIQNTSEKVERLQKQQEGKRASLLQRLQELQQAHSQISTERSALYAQIEGISTQIREMERKIAELKQQGEQEMQSMRSDFERMRQQVIFYHTHFHRALGVPISA